MTINKQHIIISLIGIVLLGATFLTGYLVGANRETIELSSDFTPIKYYLAKTRAQIVAQEDIINFVNNVNKELAKQAKYPVTYTRTKATIPTTVIENVESTGVREEELYSRVIHFYDQEGHSLPVADVTFNINNKMWSYYTMENSIIVESLINELKPDIYDFISTVKMENSKGDFINLEIKQINCLIKKQTENKWYWWKPELSLGAGIASPIPALEIQPQLTVAMSTMGYGNAFKTKYKVGEVVLGANGNNISLGIAPGSIQVREKGLFSNTYIRPITFSGQESWQFNERPLFQLSTGININF